MMIDAMKPLAQGMPALDMAEENNPTRIGQQERILNHQEHTSLHGWDR
jgi:hypothetical protein